MQIRPYRELTLPQFILLALGFYVKMKDEYTSSNTSCASQTTIVHGVSVRGHVYMFLCYDLVIDYDVRVGGVHY